MILPQGRSLRTAFDEARLFEAPFLLDGIGNVYDGAAERDPVKEVVEGFDLDSLGADRPADFRVSDGPQQEQSAADAADLAERPGKPAAANIARKEHQDDVKQANSGLR